MRQAGSILSLVLLAACSSDGDDGGNDIDNSGGNGATSGGQRATGGGSSDGGATNGGAANGGAATGSRGGDSSSGGAAMSDGGETANGGEDSGSTGGGTGALDGSGGTPPSDAGAPAGGEPGGVAASECAGRLEPAAPAGEIAVVGDGTPESCSEDALHAAAETLNEVEGGGTLSFACGGPHSIELTRSLFVATTMIVDGGGEITLSGGGAVRVIELDHYVDFTLQRITIRDGFVATGSADESGAGLLHPWFGTLRAIDVNFVDNHSESQINDVGGGAIYAGGLTEAVLSGCTFAGNSGSIGGGVLSRSTNLRVIDCVFEDNAATSYGDGQYGNGGGLYIDRMWLDAPVDFSICGSRFSRNHAKVHGSAFFSYNLEGTGAAFDRCTFEDSDMADSPDGTGTVYHEGVPLTLTRSTFARNTTNAHASGLFLGGGTDASVENCTFADNATPGNAGALWAGDGTVSLTNTTFPGNSADYGPVIFKGDSGQVTLKNVIFADNTTENEFSALACHATLEDGGGNLQWPEVKNNGSDDMPCAAGIVFADPALGPLADNGGPTATMALSAGSPALGVGEDCPGTDQRGEPRGAPCDAGAFELP